MRKWIAIALGGVAVTAAIVAGTVGYTVHQATALPDWYTEGEPERALLEGESEGPAETPQWTELPAEPDDGSAATPRTTSPRSPAADPTRKTTKRKDSDRHVMRGFHRRGKKGTTKVVKASRAVFEGGRLEAGVVLDLGKLPRDKLSTRDSKLLERASKGFPGIMRRDVYVGVEDVPVTRDGILQLGESPRLRVGKLRYDLGAAAKKLGMSPEELRGEFDRELRRIGLTAPTPG